MGWLPTFYWFLVLKASFKILLIITKFFTFIGIGAALSPAELKAAEAAERLYDQERKDMQIAKQLQVR